MKTRCDCGSYAMNHDPERELCDCCWRDMTISQLQTELSAMTTERDELMTRISAISIDWQIIAKERDELKEQLEISEETNEHK